EDSAGAHTRALWERQRAWLRAQYAFLLARARVAQRTLLREPSHWGFSLVGAVVVLILLANARRLGRAWRNRRTASRPAQAPQMAASIWYARMTRATARRGWRKLPAQTPQEFVATISEDDLRQSVDRFTRHYERARFAQSAEDAQRLPELYQEITSVRR
ncbi:MAG TPA: DUF4129 domain-containing protein, partial [Terriglobales bacterium]